MTLYQRKPDGGQTRDCIDPWFFFLLTSGRELKPCCVHPPVGILENGASLGDLLNGPAMRALRERLITGNLDEACFECPNRPLTDPGSLRRRLRAHLAQAVAHSSP